MNHDGDHVGGEGVNHDGDHVGGEGVNHDGDPCRDSGGEEGRGCRRRTSTQPPPHHPLLHGDGGVESVGT